MAISRQNMAVALDETELDVQLRNVHPGEVLGEEFMKPLALAALAGTAAPRRCAGWS